MNVFALPSSAFISPNLFAQRVGESSLMVRVNLLSKFKPNSLSTVEKNKLLVKVQVNIQRKKFVWINDVVLAYESLLIEYNDDIVNHYQVIQHLQKMYGSESVTADPLRDTANTDYAPKMYNIPVCYEYEHGDYPNDREQVLKQTGLDLATLINLHSDKQYRIFAVGFMPNFAYLGELDKRIHVARLTNPRLKVPAGAVAIADNQTAVYPAKSPGGWHIIGYTPLNLLNHPDFTFVAGEHIHFTAISSDEFEQQINQGLKDNQSA